MGRSTGPQGIHRDEREKGDQVIWCTQKDALQVVQCVQQTALGRRRCPGQCLQHSRYGALCIAGRSACSLADRGSLVSRPARIGGLVW